MINGNTHSGLQRGLCLLLAFVMLAGCTGLTAFADDSILLEEDTTDGGHRSGRGRFR